MIVQNN